MILYLHGFRSSPASIKATMMARHMELAGRAGDFFCPQLPASPSAAIALASQLCEERHPRAIIGSSLGGYYATWLAEQVGCRAVLLNPAIKAPRALSSYVGISTLYNSNEPFEFKEEYIHELPLYAVERITRPERYFLIAATGDEVLDWREMVAHYPGSRQRIIEGSDHGITDFDEYINEIMAFCDAS